MSITYKTFETFKGKYVYDRETNKVLFLSEDEYVSLKNIEEGNYSKIDIKLLESFQSKGFLQETMLKTISNPFNKVMESYLNTKLEKITFQITQECNLRCRYCIYSGHYYNQRTHSNKVMPFDNITKGVDFLMSKSHNSVSRNIGFYGGEPLLEFETIKKTVKYVEDNYPGLRTTYSLTTNGTLLNDEIIEYLFKHNFLLSISLDGPQEVHDLNRVYYSGRGSFEDIINNLNNFKDKYPNYYKSISFSAVISPNCDVRILKNYFKQPIFKDNNVRTYEVNPYGAKEDINYNENYYISNRHDKLKMILSKLGLYSKDRISTAILRNYSEISDIYAMLKSSTALGEISHPSGPCIIGATKLFMDTDGNFYPCEKVSEESSEMKIGNIQQGFDLPKVENLMNLGKLTEEECLNCWGFRLCSSCPATLDGLTKASRLNNCNNILSSKIEALKTICILKEHNYDFMEESL